MKKIIVSALMCAMLLVPSYGAFAQNHRGKPSPEKKESMRAEREAYLTEQLELTQEEADAFWPVFRDFQNKRHEAFRAQMDALKALKEGLDSGSGNIEALLQAYLDAKSNVDALSASAPTVYGSVLPAAKVAKLIVSEEGFRHRQINRLGGQDDNGDRPGKGRPGKGRPGDGHPGDGRPGDGRPGR